MVKIILTLCIIFHFYIPNGWAQASSNPDSNKPMEITADESLEWHRTELYFKANKNVKAVQGATTLFSDILKAKYRDSKDGGMDVYTILASGNVKIISAQSKVYGDKAIYNIDKGFAVITGNNLRLVSDGQVVTARDKFQYWVSAGRLEALGNAKAVRLGDTLEADKIVTIFNEDKHGKRTLKTLEAFGNVVITTPDEVLTSERAIYNAATDIAELHENVKITRGPNILEGNRAQVNLKTNISKIFGSGDNGNRVRGVFYPNSKIKPE